MLHRLDNDFYSGKRSIDFIGKRRVWFIIAVLAVVVSFSSFFIKGFNLGIEFRGGSQFTISHAQTLEQGIATNVLKANGQNEPPRVTNIGTDGLRIQTAQLSDVQTQKVKSELAKAYGVTVDKVASTYIGPTWGNDVLQKAIKSLVIFLVLILIIITIYFRTWTMSVAAIISLFHDLVVTFGIYTLVGFEVTPATVIGLLTILGYSLYDTVVVFDQMRENAKNITDQTVLTYEESTNISANQTLARSLSTSITGLLPVAGVLFIGAIMFGAGTLRDIALALFIGMIVATLSSVFIAVPLAVEFRARKEDIRQHTAIVKEIRADEGVKVSGHQAVMEALEKASEDSYSQGTHKGNKAQPRRKNRKKGGKK